MMETWSLKPLPWESEFLQCNLWRLSLPVGIGASHWDNEIAPELRQVPEDALIEAVVDAGCMAIMHKIEDAGFRLCDSKFRFLTKVQAHQLPPAPSTVPEGHNIRSYRPTDLHAVLQLTESESVQNPLLVTKFKSPWFPADTPSRWYASWIEDVLNRGAICSVLTDPDESVVGYFAYMESGELDGLPLYKGVLSAVAKNARGGRVHLALQDHLFRTQINIPEFWLDNTTQISNKPIYRNHFHSGRKPHSIHLIFLKGERKK